MAQEENDYHCDYHGKCKRKPYAEVVELDAWYYLCFWHFLLERIKLKKWAYGWCRTNEKIKE
jgi:hypothetical protein